MELEQWVAAALSGLIAVAAMVSLVQLILKVRRHKREAKEWVQKEWEDRQRPLPWMVKKKTVKKRTKRKGGSDGQ